MCLQALEAASSGRSIEAVFAFDPEVLAFSSDRKIKLIYSSVKDLSSVSSFLLPPSSFLFLVVLGLSSSTSSPPPPGLRIPSS
jgi:hypothetical protein